MRRRQMQWRMLPGFPAVRGRFPCHPPVIKTHFINWSECERVPFGMESKTRNWVKPGRLTRVSYRCNPLKRTALCGFCPERALAVLRSLLVVPRHDASRALPAPFLSRTHLATMDEMSSRKATPMAASDCTASCTAVATNHVVCRDRCSGGRYTSTNIFRYTAKKT